MRKCHRRGMYQGSRMMAGRLEEGVDIHTGEKIDGPPDIAAPQEPHLCLGQVLSQLQPHQVEEE